MRRNRKCWLTLGLFVAVPIALSGALCSRLHIRSLNDAKAHLLLAKRTGRVWADVAFGRLTSGDSLKDFVRKRRPRWDDTIGPYRFVLYGKAHPLPDLDESRIYIAIVAKADKVISAYAFVEPCDRWDWVYINPLWTPDEYAFVDVIEERYHELFMEYDESVMLREQKRQERKLHE
jgi:hypothetical protein